MADENSRENLLEILTDIQVEEIRALRNHIKILEGYSDLDLEMI